MTWCQLDAEASHALQGLLHEEDFNERIMAALRGMQPDRAVRALQYLSHAVSAEQLSGTVQFWLPILEARPLPGPLRIPYCARIRHWSSYPASVVTRGFVQCASWVLDIFVMTCIRTHEATGVQFRSVLLPLQASAASARTSCQC